MATTLDNLLQSIIDANTGFLRLNDIKVKTGQTYHFDMKAFKKANGEDDSSPCLVDEKRNQFTGTVNQFAAMRIATQPITVEWHDEFLTATGADVFKHTATALLEAGVNIKSIKLKAVHQLKMMNKVCTEANIPIYKDFCYEGYAAFCKARFDEKAGKPLGHTGTAEYRSKMYELGNTLHATTLIKERAIEANIEYLPVFEIVG